jgi:phenylacetate-CoA ligase
MLELYRRMLALVPAYGHFLAENGIDPATIRGLADLTRLPLLTKANYIQRYPLAELVPGGRLESCDTMALSSGSTGAATFWPRFVTDELAVAVRFEQVFQDSFAAHERRTLAIVCFALGSWVGGLFTLACCRHLAAKGYPLVTLAPGMNKPEIYRILTELGPPFDQVVLLGYPPYLKDVIDGGPAAGVDWAKLKTRLVTAGEVFSEEWRSLVGGRLGSTNPRYDIASLYGTADGGVLANETPLSIHIRRFLADHPEIGRELFGEARLPTLAQYDPHHRYFEAVEGTLIFSGDTGLPLLRYHIADSGGLIGYDEMLRFLARHGFDPRAGLAGQGWRGVRRLPFVYVFGRANFAVSFFGANVYPENIAIGLEQAEIAPWTTGKFVLMVREGLSEAAALHVVVELAPGITADAEKERRMADSILAQLLRLNSEFANYAPADYRRPVVELKPAGDPGWFPGGVKHRYSRR